MSMSTTEFETLLYTTAGPVATITLNRPERLNTIVPPMPDEIEAAIGLAERDSRIKVIVLRGSGRAFSGGYDFSGGFQHWGSHDDRWEVGSGQGFRDGHRATDGANAEVHGHLAGVQAGDRPSARLVRGRGQ